MDCRSFILRIAALALAVHLSACHAPGPVAPDARTTTPLRLISSQTLILPDSCKASGSVIVDFTVLASGQTDNIQPAAAPSCVQQALTAWVASFRYSPLIAPTSTSVEWLLVEAKRGS